MCVPICFIQIYTKGAARARAPKKKRDTLFRERIAHDCLAEEDPSSGASSECLCLPFFPFTLFFLSFRHSEYVVPILTGVPFSSVKMKNQKALDLRSSA